MATDRPPRAARGWTRGEAIVVAAGALLVADLLFLTWYRVAIDLNLEQFGVQLPSFSLNRSGVQDPQAFFGIASVVVASLMVAQIIAAKITGALPRGEQVHLVAGAVVLGLIVAKLIATKDFLGVGAWGGFALAGALAYGGFVLSQETSAGTGRTVPTP